MESLLIVILTVYSFVYNLSILIFAKLFGVRVEKFYIWYNPGFTIFKFNLKNTEYGLGWLPLGGYCKISGMVEAEGVEPQPYDFLSKTFGKQLWLILSGPLLMLASGIIIYPYAIPLQNIPVAYPVLFLILAFVLLGCCLMKGKLRNISGTVVYLFVYILFAAIVIVLLLIICEVTPLKEHLYKFFFDVAELKGKLKIMSVEKIRLISAYLGFTLIALNLLPLGATNGSILIKLIYNRMTGETEPKIATILNSATMIVIPIIFVWGIISLIRIIF